jgi:hypothetical protein
LPSDNQIVHFELPFFINGELCPFKLDIEKKNGQIRFGADGNWFGMNDVIKACNTMETALILGVFGDEALELNATLAEERTSNTANKVDVAGKHQPLSLVGAPPIMEKTVLEIAEEQVKKALEVYTAAFQEQQPFYKRATNGQGLQLAALQSIAAKLLTETADKPVTLDGKFNVVSPPVDPLEQYSLTTSIASNGLGAMWWMYDNSALVMQYFLLAKMLWGFCRSKYVGESMANFSTLLGFFFAVQYFFPSLVFMAMEVESNYIGVGHQLKVKANVCSKGPNSSGCKTATENFEFIYANQQKYWREWYDWAHIRMGALETMAEGMLAVYTPSIQGRSWNPLSGYIKYRNICCDMVRIIAGYDSPHAPAIEGVKLLYGNGLKWAQTTHGRELHELLKNERRNRWRINEIKRDIQDAQKVNFSTPAGKSNWNDFASNIKAHSQ